MDAGAGCACFGFEAMAGRFRRLGLEPVDGNLYVFFSPHRTLAGIQYFGLEEHRRLEFR